MTKVTTKGKQVAVQDSNPALVEIELNKIDPNPWQPRTTAPTDLEMGELLNSIKAVGQTVPILVRPHPTKNERFELADGAMRKLIAQRLGKKRIKALVEPKTDRQMKILAIAANTFVRLHDDDKEAAVYEIWQTEFKTEEPSSKGGRRDAEYTGIREMERETGIDSGNIVRYLQGRETRLALGGTKIEIKTGKGKPVDSATRKEVLTMIAEDETPAIIAKKLELDQASVEDAAAMKRVSNRDLSKLKDLAKTSPKAAKEIIRAREKDTLQSRDLSAVVKTLEKSKTPEQDTVQIVKRESGVTVEQVIKKLETDRETTEESHTRMRKEAEEQEKERQRQEKELIAQAAQNKEKLDRVLLGTYESLDTAANGFAARIAASENETLFSQIANVRNQNIKREIENRVRSIAVRMREVAAACTAFAAKFKE